MLFTIEDKEFYHLLPLTIHGIIRKVFRSCTWVATCLLYDKLHLIMISLNPNMSWQKKVSVFISGGDGEYRVCLLTREFVKAATIAEVWVCTSAVGFLQGRAMAQAVSRRPLTAEAWFRARVNPCGIYGGQSGSGTDFFPSSSVFSVNIITPSLSNPCHLGDEQYGR
jgi:hypothetical protein